MSSVFRREGNEPVEVSTSWELESQIQEICQWLEDARNADLVRGSVLDIGFNSRLGNEVAVQGETIPLVFMQQLVALNVQLWLSIYPTFDEASDGGPDIPSG
jgi:hypothetical protein